LLFVGQGASGRGGTGGGGANTLRAFDKASGKVIAEITIPAQPTGTPMTYLANGRQFIVIATNDGRLVALALPQA
jgi:quinoprotein glucose dehydrogenase